MRDFVIITDASCDLPVDVVEKNGVLVAPMSINFDGTNYKHHYDYRELSVNQFYDGMKAGKIGSTAGTNIQDAIDIMKHVLDEDKDVIFLSISSALSCSYQNACLAASELVDEYPSARISIIDTKSVCASLGLLTYLTAQKKADGFDYDQILDYAKTMSERMHINFTVDDLSYLQRSGRLSHLSSIVGTIIGVKPILAIGGDGKIKTEGKARGRKASIKRIIDLAAEMQIDGSIFMISHASSMADAEIIRSRLSEHCPGAKFIIGDIGPIIGVNTGVGTLAIACVGETR